MAHDRREPRRGAGLARLALAGLTLAGCETVPATGESRLALIGDRQAAQIGRRQHPQIVNQYGGAYDQTPTGEALSSYLDSLGGRLVEAVPEAERSFHFTLLNTGKVNAFALPGGYIYATRGILAWANSEAQLASILGHEIAHVTARHAARQMTQGRLAKLGTALAGAVLTEPGSAGSAAFNRAAAVGRQAYLASYSRDQEAQADRLGLQYLADAGYHPGASATMLRQLQRKKELAVRLGKRGEAGALARLFRDHPRTPKRVRQARKAAELADTGGKHARRRYFQHIDGMLYGPDPDLGVVAERTLIRRDPAYRLTLPKGWVLRRTSHGVITAPEERGPPLVLLDDAPLPGGPDSLERHLRETWLSEARAIEHVRKRRIASRPAVTALAALPAGRDHYGAQVAAIALGDGQVLRLQIRPAELTVGLPTALRGMLNSLDTLSAEERAASAPRRIRIVDPQPGTTWKELADRSAFDDHGPARLRALNGGAPDGPVPNRRIKLVVADSQS